MRDTGEVVLKTLTAAIVTGSLTLIDALPATADRSTSYVRFGRFRPIGRRRWFFSR